MKKTAFFSQSKTWLLFFILIQVMLLNSSCDPCDKITCLNGGTCDDGRCECPTGFSGTNCEKKDPPVINCSNPDKITDVRILSPTSTSSVYDPVFNRNAAISVKVRFTPRTDCAKISRVVVQIRRRGDDKLIKTLSDRQINQTTSTIYNYTGTYVPKEDELYYVVAKAYSIGTSSVGEDRIYFTVMTKYTSSCGVEITANDYYKGTIVKRNQLFEIGFSFRNPSICVGNLELEIIIWKLNSNGEYVFNQYLTNGSKLGGAVGSYYGFNRAFSSTGTYLVEARTRHSTQGIKNAARFYFDVIP